MPKQAQCIAIAVLRQRGMGFPIVLFLTNSKTGENMDNHLLSSSVVLHKKQHMVEKTESRSTVILSLRSPSL